MGLLDDAIREHLELKRRRGADPDEVARQEDEALGELRNQPEAAAIEETEPEAPAEEPAAEEPAPPQEEQEPWLRESPAEEPQEPEPEPEPEEPEAVAPDEEPAADEDVLEETPDFLQETPEHDRLWFEQKPPRDFDFD
jgi:hypothetical protein